MKIKLTNGQTALVDNADFALLSKYSWHITRGYAETYIPDKTNKSGYKAVAMHRLIMSAKRNELVDHINMNRLDNRQQNLRICTRSQNGMNRTKTKRNKTGYKGVAPVLKRFGAYIQLNGKTIYLGCYDTPELAHNAYKIATKKYHGEFART